MTAPTTDAVYTSLARLLQRGYTVRIAPAATGYVVRVTRLVDPLLPGTSVQQEFAAACWPEAVQLAGLYAAPPLPGAEEEEPWS